MIPLTQNPKVRIFVEQSTGRVMRAETNVAPLMPVEVVKVKDGETISDKRESLVGHMPFQCETN